MNLQKKNLQESNLPEEEKKNIKQKEMDLDIAYLMKNQNIQVLFLQDIIKMDLKF